MLHERQSLVLRRLHPMRAKQGDGILSLQVLCHSSTRSHTLWLIHPPAPTRPLPSFALLSAQLPSLGPAGPVRLVLAHAPPSPSFPFLPLYPTTPAWVLGCIQLADIVCARMSPCALRRSVGWRPGRGARETAALGWTRAGQGPPQGWSRAFCSSSRA